MDDIVNTVRLLAGSFGGVNLEDISAPRCFEIEKKLKECCDIPIFHDDQHGTAVITLAGVINALKLVGKKLDEVKIVTSGAGAAGIAIIRLLISMGLKNVIMTDRKGAIYEGRDGLNPIKEEMAKITNYNHEKRHACRGNQRSRYFYWRFCAGYAHSRYGTYDGKRSDHLCLRKSDAGDFPGRGESSRSSRCQHRKKRLPEPGQQRTLLPGHLPRSARCESI